MNNIQPEQPASHRIVLYQCICLVLYLKNLLEKHSSFCKCGNRSRKRKPSALMDKLTLSHHHWYPKAEGSGDSGKPFL